MSKLPLISGKECIKALGKAGFYVLRQRGSHLILRRDEPFAEVVVPNHQELDKLRSCTIIFIAQEIYFLAQSLSQLKLTR